MSSTGELIFDIAKSLDWPLSIKTLEFLMNALLADTQGLSNSLTTADTYRVMAYMIESGVNRSALEEARRKQTKMSQSIFKYKASLITRTEFYADGQLAYVSLPQSEINEYSPSYNPPALIQPDMLQTEGVGICVVLKHYADGHVTASIRCNTNFPIAAKLAEQFGGGGHDYAAGFKLTDNQEPEEIKRKIISATIDLLTTTRVK